jgi:hypothetical protein
MTNTHYIRDIFEKEYTDLEKDIPIWTTEQLEVFETAETQFEIGCELAWKEDHPVSSWPAPTEASFDPRTFKYSSQKMMDIAFCMVLEAGIPLPDTTI